MSGMICKWCGGVNTMRGIVLGYAEGPLAIDEDGKVRVQGSDFEPYIGERIERGCVLCEVCAHTEYEIESDAVCAMLEAM